MKKTNKQMNDIKLNYDDITIVPEKITDIASRKECNPFDEDGMLPIFASCMSSVVSMANSSDFNKSKIRTVIPRSYSIDNRVTYLFYQKDNFNFVAFSLEETRELFIKNNIFEKDASIREDYHKDKNSIRPIKICIDLANGHMRCLLDMVKEIKSKYNDKVIVMTGNIANPETYRDYEEAGVDYARFSVGTGDACLTSSNTAIHMPIFSLLKEAYEIKEEIKGKCKIVADGGIRGYRDIQKALIYADYVMIGSLFNRAMESAGKTTYGSFYWNIRGKKIYRPIKTLLKYGKEIPKEDYEKVYQLIKDNKLTVWKEFYGQSTKIAQALIASANTQTLKNLKTSEGLFKYQKVEYCLTKWVENEIDYLRSAMSYTNSRTLEEYKNSRWARISQIKYNK